MVRERPPLNRRRWLALALVLVAGCASPDTARTLRSEPAPLDAFVVRLLPGDDPKLALERIVAEERLEAVVVLSCAGSLARAAVRFADKSEPTILEEKLEIVSLTGTLSCTGGSHLHVALADGTGKTIGGHLKEGSRVYTTAEITLGIPRGVRFVREPDPRTGYPELWIVASPRDR
jgi:predicted DNA-binding protein with PD1-like motif